jgi:flagellar motor switch protein FliN/FliY
MSDIVQDPASSLVQQVAEAASSVLSQVAGATLQAQPVPLDIPIQAATLIRIDLSGALEGICEIALSAPMTAQFAALLTGEPPEPEGEISSDTREAAVELVQQICGNAADRLRGVFGPLELKSRLGERDPASGARQRLLIARGGGALDFELHILRLTSPAKPAAAAQPAPQPAVQPAAKPANAGAALSSNRNLDLLLDIELGVTLRFGTRHMPLKDILELCSGSVVELDRRVEEPVDLLIDGRLIAQGEVVIVEGNYGLRILQVAAQGEKIACLP